MISSPEYLTNNLHLIRQLIGQKIKSITRLTSLEPEDELRLELGSLLLETYSGFRLYINVDEGLGNIIVFNASYTHININCKINEFFYQSEIYPENKFPSIFNSFFVAPIDNIEIISRSDSIQTFFTMCGFKLNFPGGKSLYFGSYLTDLKSPELCLLFPEEVEENLILQNINS